VRKGGVVESVEGPGMERHVVCRGVLVNVYSVLVRKEINGRPNVGWETLLHLF
jgi:hypothetical protein